MAPHPSAGRPDDQEAAAPAGAQRPPLSHQPPLISEPSVGIPADIAARYNVRYLDPSTAVRLADQPPPRPTLYVSDTMLVGGVYGDRAAYSRLENVTRGLGLRMDVDPQVAERTRALLADQRLGEGRRELAQTWVDRVKISRDLSQPSPPVDAWTVLQAYRADVGRGSELHGAVALEHLVGATPGIGGNPFTDSSGIGGNPFTDSSAFADPLGQYAAPGRGGRMPVRYVGPAPTGILDEPGSGPVVAVLDTHVGQHDWLGSPWVLRDQEVLGLPLDLPLLTTDATGSTDPLVGDLDRDAGHGTFIAGLVRQACPDAVVLAARLFRGDGVVAEGDLLTCLQRLAAYHLLGLAGVDGFRPVDVVSLSLGYYHEQPQDADFDGLLRAPLRLLGQHGVAVVVSAGNDATSRPMYPGAFAAYPGGPVPAEADVVPVTCVGARNPNGSVALFSNAGPWVLAHEPGAALVSTFSTTVAGALQPGTSLSGPGGELRANIDPDDFSGGFAVWSGTSFAAPVLAGRLAAALLELRQSGSAGSRVDQAWSAVTALTKASRP